MEPPVSHVRGGSWTRRLRGSVSPWEGAVGLGAWGLEPPAWAGILGAPLTGRVPLGE